MDGIAYSEYKMLLDTTSMEWVVAGYFTHILLAIFQGWLAVALSFSGVANLLDLKEVYGLRFLGALTHIKTDRRRSGVVQLAVGIALLLPFSVGLPSFFSNAACLGAVVILFLFERQEKTDLRKAGSITRRAMTVFAMLCFGVGIVEQKDHIRFGLDIAFTAKHHRDREIAWQLKSDQTSPKFGDIAPDFVLQTADGSQSVRLSQVLSGGKPVVLFFGANSCPAFSEGTKGLNRLHQKYKDRVEFLGVYVKEPHPTDEWWLTPSKWMSYLHRLEQSRAAVDIQQPTSLAQRNRVAARAHAQLLNAGMTLLVDDIDNAVNNQWTGQPTRIYLLSPEGKIIYNPGMGPYSFNPNYLEPEIEKYFANPELAIQGVHQVSRH